MFNWLKKLFGEGYVYSEFILTDGTTGRSRAPYVGDPDTFDREAYAEELKKEIWFKRRRRIKTVTSIWIK